MLMTLMGYSLDTPPRVVVDSQTTSCTTVSTLAGGLIYQFLQTRVFVDGGCVPIAPGYANSIVSLDLN